MFNNIGKLIKIVAIITCVLGILGCIFCGFVMIFIDSDMFIPAISLIFLGPIVCWISTFTYYGFGQLIDNSDKIVKAMDADTVIAQREAFKRKSAMLNNLKNRGLISEEEYEQKMGELKDEQ